MTLFNKKPLVLDEIVGHRCKVINTIDNYVGGGLVKIGSSVWAARAVDDNDIYEIGEKLVIVAVEGVKLICRK
jgi:membrane protein implicated in regulation of membrane protease activity